MKKVFLFFIHIILILKAEAQVNMGLKLNPGFGFIRSSSLDKIASTEKANDGKVIESNAHTGAGFNMGIGGFYQYNINPAFSILAEPTFNLLYTRTYLNYKKEVIDKDGSGRQVRISSIAKISMLYFNLPFLVRYTVWERKKLFVTGGFSVNFNTKPKLKSEETKISTDYMYENVKESSIQKVDNKATLDNYSLFQPHFVIGIGKNFRRKLKNLSVDIRYSLPLTKNSLYSSDSSISSNTMNNSVFSSKDYWQMGNSTNNLIRPNNYGLGVINLSIKYTLVKKTKN